MNEAWLISWLLAQVIILAFLAGYFIGRNEESKKSKKEIDMTQIDQIRQEIERLKNNSESAKMEWINEGYNQNAFAEDCRIGSFDKLLSFLDTLSEESDKSLEEAAEEYANKHYSEWDESWDDYNGHNVEPENDKLELIDAFIAGAEWVSIYGNDIKEL